MIKSILNIAKSLIKKNNFNFSGGMHFSDTGKHLSANNSIEVHGISQLYVMSLRQKDANYLEPICKIGQRVLSGEIIARPSNKHGVNLHAPTSGIIENIDFLADLHQSKEPCLSIVLRADFEDEKKFFPSLDPKNASCEKLLKRIADCGIVGLGGAGFPSARKLNNNANILIVNAAECEPYITCDDLLIRSNPAEVLVGAQIAAKILQAEKIIIAIEDDKPEAISALKNIILEANSLLKKSHHGEYIEITDAQIPFWQVQTDLKVLATRYPSGNSRQLIELLLNRRISPRVHLSQEGIIIHNSSTLKAIFDAVYLGKPLIERLITITGEEIKHPHNRLVKIGTPLEELVAAAGGIKNTAKCLIGGSMMGFEQQNLQVGMDKTANCLLFLSKKEEPSAQNCIRCARCAAVCPMKLLPQQIYWYSRNLDFKRLQAENIFDCSECAVCETVCPSRIPLVEYFKNSKKQIRNEQNKINRQEKAKLRNISRLQRLERIAQERKQASLSRLKSKVEKQVDNNTVEVSEINAHKMQTDSVNSKMSLEEKQAAIEAAKARAAAKRAERLKGKQEQQ